jgi:hypothetical protein
VVGCQENSNRIIKNGFGERVFNWTFAAAENGGVTVDLCCANCDKCFPELNTPYGSYSLTLEGVSGEIERIIHVEKPQEAQVYRNGTHLILYNFQPNEKGRIFLYNESLIEKSDLLRADSMSGLHHAWDVFQVDGSGQLILEIEKVQTTEEYFLIGNSSGEGTCTVRLGTNK